MKNYKIIQFFVGTLLLSPSSALACASSEVMIGEYISAKLKLAILLFSILLVPFFIAFYKSKKKMIKKVVLSLLVILSILIVLLISISIWINSIQKEDMKDIIECEKKCKVDRPCFCNPICN